MPHRHRTFSIPRILWRLVERDRNLPGLLSQTAYACVLKTFQSLAATEIRFMAPPHDNGIVSIKVASPAGFAYCEYLYVPPKLEDLPPGYITTGAGIA